MIGAAKGYRVKLVMPAWVSAERRGVLEAYGLKKMQDAIVPDIYEDQHLHRKMLI